MAQVYCLRGKLIPIVSLMLCFLIGSLVLMASDKPKLDGKELIDRAAARTNIFDLPSFEIRASVKIDNYGKPLEGSYLLLWNGPERWREEISLPGYSEVRVGGKGIVFLKRSTDFIPVPIDQLHSTLGYGPELNSSRFVHIALRSDEIVKKVQSQKVNGSEADCAEIVDRESHSRQVCVDKRNGALVRQSPFRDGEMIETGGKLFPRVLSYLEKGKTLAQVQVTEFKTTGPFSPSVFEPPQGALSTSPGCMNPVPVRLVKKVQPRYPQPERQSRVEGTVKMNAWIRKDGSVSDLRIISGVTTGLNNASLEALRQWRYEPATCDGLAVDIETVLTVNYSIRELY